MCVNSNEYMVNFFKSLSNKLNKFGKKNVAPVNCDVKNMKL